MWMSPKVVLGPSEEPVSLADARDQCSIDPDDTTHDAKLARFIAAARGHCESYCGRVFAARVLELRCTDFADLARVEVAPIAAIAAITYFDPAGAEQTLDPAVFTLRADDFSTAIVLSPGQSWPRVQPGSVITLQVEAGGDVPAEVIQAMHLFIADSFENRENAKRADWTALDTLLCNQRR